MPGELIQYKNLKGIVMKRRMLLTIVVIFFSCTVFANDESQSIPGLKKHLNYLASDRLEGRGLGTASIDSAAHYISQVFEKNG